MKIQDLMTPNAESCTPQANLSAAAMIMWRQDCGIVPVIDAQREVVGVITDRDICMAVATRHRAPEDVSVADVMTRQVSCVRRTDDIQAALDRMTAARVRRLPVVDESGKLEGIVSLNDLVQHHDPTARRGSGLTAAELVNAMGIICAHQVPARTGERQEQKRREKPAEKPREGVVQMR